MRRVVITGLGPVTPIGVGAQVYHRAQLDGTSGVSLVTRLDMEHIACKFAGQLDIDFTQFLDKKEIKVWDPFIQLAVIASDLAMADSGLTVDQLDLERFGTVIGSGIGGIGAWESNFKNLWEKHAGRISPFFVPMSICNMAAGIVSMRYGAQGPSSCVVTACATGTGNIGDAMRTIQLGEADVMLAGGAEASVTTMSMAGFANMKALSFRNDSPETASRPFCASRDGFVLGEGAGIVVLEELEHAKRRGARIYAELVGYSTSADAHHMTNPAPSGSGAARAMRNALKSAGIHPEQVGYINAHGTSTPAGDLAETQAIKAVYGAHAYNLAVSSTKSMTGHLLGAAGAIEAIATAQALYSGVLPPTINHFDPDPELDLDFIPNVARETSVEFAVSNSFAFGGQNAVLVFKRFE
ncbi:MAG: beta-ketoacyl-ACP synthase II [Deinococcaceae bacterium]